MAFCGQGCFCVLYEVSFTVTAMKKVLSPLKMKVLVGANLFAQVIVFQGANKFAPTKKQTALSR
jgi:hypothetical protein